MGELRVDIVILCVSIMDTTQNTRTHIAHAQSLQCFFIFLAIVAGGIFYEEFAKFTGPQYGGFFTGVVIILAGVYGLAPTDVDTMVVPVTYDVDAELAKLENEKISGTPAEGPTAFATGISAVDNSAEVESLIDEKRQAMEGDTNLFSKPTTGDAESVTKSSRKIVKRGDSLAQ